MRAFRSCLISKTVSKVSDAKPFWLGLGPSAMDDIKLNQMMIVYFTRTDNRKYSTIRLTNYIKLNQIASIVNSAISPNSKACIHQSENKSSIQAGTPILFDSMEN
jgi:hypothetical protein